MKMYSELQRINNLQNYRIKSLQGNNLDGEVIVGNLNQVYPIRILGDAKMEGTNAVYKCETMGGLTQGIPVERLLAGERFSIEYAPVEREGSRKVGDIRFSTPVSMRNEWSTIRIHHKVWGNKLGKKLAFGIPMVRNVDGKQVKDTANMWIEIVVCSQAA